MLAPNLLRGSERSGVSLSQTNSGMALICSSVVRFAFVGAAAYQFGGELLAPVNSLMTHRSRCPWPAPLVLALWRIVAALRRASWYLHRRPPHGVTSVFRLDPTRSDAVIKLFLPVVDLSQLSDSVTNLICTVNQLVSRLVNEPAPAKGI